MKNVRLLLATALATALLGCGGDDGTTPPPADDADNDGLTDVQEGAAGNVDTDGDGTPDFQDADSDGDGIDDYREAGDDDLATSPFDSDSDGTPDFRDTDSDNNGRVDGVDGAGDLDSDGRPDFADLDDDGDAMTDVLEIGADATNPVDTDGDGNPDFSDTDSDNDTIPDLHDGVVDYDGDGLGNWRDTDSDGDCLSDQLESGGAIPPRDTDGDTRPDFNDRDSDDDGLTDGAEDANCNGVRDGAESSATTGDTDGDGVSDLIEEAAGTDANDASDNPQANGDFVFIEPYMGAQTPTEDDLDFQTRVQNLDLYVLIDRSGSMASETTSIKDNMGGVVDRLQCPPFGTGAPATCLSNLWAGLGGIGYTTTQPFTNYLSIQSDPNFSGTTVSNVSGSSTNEPLTFGTWASITGNGSSGSGCSVSSTPARTGCPAGTFGYPCFRAGVIPVIALVTDEPPLSSGGTYVCPDRTTVASAMNARNAKLLGIYGSGSSSTVIGDLQNMARDTGAIDAAAGNAPLVFSGADAAAATAIEDGIRTLAGGLPLDMAAAANDDPSDGVDAIASFIDHLETLQLGTAQCANGLADLDTNGDGFRDSFDNVRAGTPVCWKLVSKPNTTVPATNEPQLFRATVVVTGDGVTELDRRDVFFLVPPVPQDPPIG
jgi:hypothetical protein